MSASNFLLQAHSWKEMTLSNEKCVFSSDTLAALANISHDWIIYFVLLACVVWRRLETAWRFYHCHLNSRLIDFLEVPFYFHRLFKSHLKFLKLV